MVQSLRPNRPDFARSHVRYIKPVMLSYIHAKRDTSSVVEFVYQVCDLAQEEALI
jgi:hypothetical protein